MNSFKNLGAGRGGYSELSGDLRQRKAELIIRRAALT